ncbi:glycerophosphodiester phosphodiesterase family protein [Pedobacter sp. P351]|uniref:glycerophosphodiester phosphodiesterase family protein n=1 Tax=Pedobacter superstes TaxID=3133441 RepID=UPI0030B194EA
MTLPKKFPEFYKEGHRGARGLMPENTIISMTKAIEEGANVIELDVYTSKDGKVIVTHDPSVNSAHSLNPDGKELDKEEAKKFVFHQMEYEDIRKFDVGSKIYKAFPKQKKVAAYIPLLGDLIDSVEHFTQTKKLPGTIYNIELKTSKSFDSKYNSKPEDLVDEVMKVIKSKNISNRFYIQSFDVRPLKYIRTKYPKVTIALLTSSKKPFEEIIKQLGFVPPIYSPDHLLVTAGLVAKCHSAKAKIIPWTINSKAKMQKLIYLGVDGIITDYPNYFSELNKASILKRKFLLDH